MKRRFLALLIILLAGNASINAQNFYDEERGTTFGIGVEAGFSLTDGFADWHFPGVGGVLRLGFPLTEKIDFTATGTLLRFQRKDSDKDVNPSPGSLMLTMLQGGFRYNFGEVTLDGSTLYLEPKGGLAVIGIKNRSFGAAYAAALGYVVDGHIDVSVRYQVVSKNGSFKFLGVGIGWNF
jgi:hypothetical protein